VAIAGLCITKVHVIVGPRLLPRGSLQSKAEATCRASAGPCRTAFRARHRRSTGRAARTRSSAAGLAVSQREAGAPEGL